MPYEAFYKLDDTKKKKILDAMEKEFGNNTFEEASINKIVEDAGISKGSFWFYFENKKEAIKFIVESHMQKEKELAIKFLKESNGDIFETYKKMFDFFIDNRSNNEKKELMPNICRDLIVNSRKDFEKPPKVENLLIEEKEFLELLDKDLIKDLDKEEIFLIVKHLNFSLRSNLLDFMTETVDIKTAKKVFLKEIELLKGGMYKNA